MNTQEIQKCMKKINPCLEFNVFAANRIPMIIEAPVYIITNLDPDTKQGSHWVAINIDVNGIGQYFDSYGRPPTSQHKLFLFRNTRKWFYNNKLLQSYYTSVCGQYCLMYLYFKYKGMSMHEFLEGFSNNTLYNDVLINSMFNAIF